MATSSWLNRNAHRAFPLQEGAGSPIPSEVLLDFGCLMGQDSGFDPSIHSVWLAAIRRAGTYTFQFVFESDAPGCVGRPLVFTRTLGEKNVTEFVERFS